MRPITRFADLNIVADDGQLDRRSRLPILEVFAPSRLTGHGDLSPERTPHDTSLHQWRDHGEGARKPPDPLVALGARMDHITQAVMRNKATLALGFGASCSHGSISTQRTASRPPTCGTPMRTAFHPEAIEGLSNFLSATLADADAMLTLRETPDGFIKGSPAAPPRFFRLAQALGGGGHKSCRIRHSGTHRRDARRTMDHPRLALTF